MAANVMQTLHIVNQEVEFYIQTLNILIYMMFFKGIVNWKKEPVNFR